MANKGIRHIELLAPARDMAVGVDAIDHGADAVYIGARAFGARAAASNSVQDIARLADYAHRFDARVYATVNTIVYDNELRDVERLVVELYRAGVDALIVQDMALLELDLPPIALHSSTQCDLRTPEKAAFLESLGFSQLVMARELTLDEISAIYAAVKVPLESFCHGALCVSYSGRCQLSQALKGRSANRGECAQLCRMAWDLTDAQGNVIIKDKHLLSLRDFNASWHIGRLLDAGVSSFKIEGRLKDSAYVKNVVAYYRRLIDRQLEGRDDCIRLSHGSSTYTFTPNLEKSFNRSFTSYFLDGRRPANGTKMASLVTPKSLGEPLGIVKSCRGNVMVINTSKKMANGDGLSFVGQDGKFAGCRVNVATGNRVTLRERIDIPRGTMVYRTHDKAMDDVLEKESAVRKIALDAELWVAGDRLCLRLNDERGDMVVQTVETAPLEEARTSQSQRQRDVLAKLGNTHYQLREAVTLDDRFIPASILTALRREAVESLEATHEARRAADHRRAESLTSLYPTSSLVSADNVANHMAERLYRRHGVENIEPAIEVDTAAVGDRPLMHTRYCLRRELGACLLDKKRRTSLPDKMFLSQPGTPPIEVRCHCDTCEMTLHLTDVDR